VKRLNRQGLSYLSSLDFGPTRAFGGPNRKTVIGNLALEQAAGQDVIRSGDRAQGDVG
jgi:hypothetical protein